MNTSTFVTFFPRRLLRSGAAAVAAMLLLSGTHATAELFGTPQVIRSGQAPATWVQTADMNGDGLQDILYSPAAGKLDVLLRNANGTWTTLPIITGGLQAIHNAVVSDFDGNGRPDIAVYAQKSATDTGVMLVRQTTAGVYDAAGAIYTTVSPAPATFGPMRLADVDKDGNLDLVLAWKTATGAARGRAGWLKGMGLSFESLSGLFLQTFNDPTDVEAADFDRDGDIDIAVVDGDVRIFPGPDFDSRTILTTAGNPQRVRCVDHNRDGWLDLIVSHVSTGIRAYNGGAGGFVSSGLNFSEVGLAGNEWITTGDIDLDGLNDVGVALATTPGAGAAMLNNGVSSDYHRMPDFGASTGVLASVDDDGDGDLDFICGTTTGLVRVPNILPHRGVVSADQTAVSPSNSMPVGPTSAVGFATADFDRNGTDDVAAATASTGEIRVFLSNGVTLGGGTVIGTVPNVRHLVAADLDGDGDTDLAAPSLATGRVLWFANNGAATAWTQNVIPYAIATPFGLACGDLDRDGKLDLVTASATGGTLHLLAGNGDGTFVGSTLTTMPSVSQVEIADISPGGLQEVIVRHGSAGNVTMLRYGIGGWNSITVMPPPFTGGEGMTIADFDGNGLCDVAAGFGAAVYVARQTQVGAFAAPELVALGTLLPGGGNSTVRSLRAADLDADGRPEIVAAMQTVVAAVFPHLADRRDKLPVVLAQSPAEPQTDTALIRFGASVTPTVVMHPVTSQYLVGALPRTATVQITGASTWSLAGTASYPVQGDSTIPLLSLTITSLAWPGDADATMTKLPVALRRDGSSSFPISGPEAAATFESFSLWTDLATPGVLDPGASDLRLTDAPVPAPDSLGHMTLPLTTPVLVRAGSSQPCILGAKTGAMISGVAFRLETESRPFDGSVTTFPGGEASLPLESSTGTAAAHFVLSTPTPRQIWRGNRFGFTANIGKAADTADPDGDGLVNMMEYALGLNPEKPDAPRTELSNLGPEFYYSFWPWFGNYDIGLRVQSTTDLKVWHDRAARQLNGAWQTFDSNVLAGNTQGSLRQQIVYVTRLPGKTEMFRLAGEELAP